MESFSKTTDTKLIHATPLIFLETVITQIMESGYLIVMEKWRYNKSELYVPKQVDFKNY